MLPWIRRLTVLMAMNGIYSSWAIVLHLPVRGIRKRFLKAMAKCTSFSAPMAGWLASTAMRLRSRLPEMLMGWLLDLDLAP